MLSVILSVRGKLTLDESEASERRRASSSLLGVPVPVPDQRKEQSLLPRQTGGQKVT